MNKKTPTVFIYGNNQWLLLQLVVREVEKVNSTMHADVS